MLPIICFSRRAAKRFCSAIALMRKPLLLTSANSAATKNALAASRDTASSRLTIVSLITFIVAAHSSSGRKLFGDESGQLVGHKIAGDGGLADAAHQNERELTARDLLILRYQIHHRVDAGPIAAGHV